MSDRVSDALEQSRHKEDVLLRKEFNEQMSQLNKTLITLVDELKKVQSGLADVSNAVRSSAAMSADRR